MPILKNYFLSIIAMFFTVIISSQEKIKGNKILEVKTTEFDTYKILEISDNFEVVLFEQEAPRVRVETDSNLHKYIKVNLSSEKLSISTTESLSKFKKLYVEIGYNSSLAQIIVKDKVNIRGNTEIKTERMELAASETSKVDLNFTSFSRVEIKTSGKTKINSIINAESVTILGNNDTNIITTATTEALNITLDGESKLNINGTTASSTVFLQDSTHLFSSGLNCNIANLTIKGAAEAYIKVTDKFKLNASGSSETYVLGNPLFELPSFNDESKLIKIKKQPATGLKRFLK